MTDRELLEKAAKAAGFRIDKSETNGGGRDNTGFDCMGSAVLDWHNGISWNPLNNDGHALRLAVELRIEVGFNDDCSEVDVWTPHRSHDILYEGYGNDVNAATRRAITRAAAAIQDAREARDA